MKINEETLKKILNCIRSENNMLILHMIPETSCMRYSEMKSKFNTLKKIDEDDNTFAHHLRVLVRLGLLRKNDERVYFLTRIGIRTIEVLNNFKNICVEYDLSEVDSDGKIKMIVVGRKL